MKLVLLLALCCLALHNGKGAPANARYKFVRCTPNSNQANCVTYQSPEVTWSPDLPAKMPASSAKHLEAEPVEDEHPDREGDEEDELEKEESQLIGDEGESPIYDNGSGFFEGSADTFIADQGFMTTESETGSGEGDMDLYKGEDKSPWPLVYEAKPEEQELKEDHLLQL